MEKKKVQKVIIAGSRSFNNYALLSSRVSGILANIENPIIVSGTAAGADRLGERYAAEHGLQLLQFPANWEAHGKAAGFIRNQEMAENADALILFWDGKSRGSKNMLMHAKRQGLLIRIINTNPTPQPVQVVNLGTRQTAPCIKVDRTTPLGNPYRIPENTRDEAIFNYRKWLGNQLLNWPQDPPAQLFFSIKNQLRLKGHVILACHCAPLACHADIIKEFLLHNITPPGSPASPLRLPEQNTDIIFDEYLEKNTPFFSVSHEASLFNHTAYGESYVAMADHVSEMSGLDRIIFEDCIITGATVMAPHINEQKTLRHFFAPYIMSQIPTATIREALDFIAFFKSLEATPEMVEQFLSWINAKGIAPALKYFGSLCADLASLGTPDTDALETNPAPYFEDTELEIYEAPNENDAVASEYSYHVLGEVEAPDFFESLDEKTTATLSTIQNATPESIPSIGKALFNTTSTDKKTASYIWNAYNQKKASFIKPPAQETVSIITNLQALSFMELKQAGQNLYLSQQNSQLDKTQWSHIWATYKTELRKKEPQQQLFT